MKSKKENNNNKLHLSNPSSCSNQWRDSLIILSISWINPNWFLCFAFLRIHKFNGFVFLLWLGSEMLASKTSKLFCCAENLILTMFSWIENNYSNTKQKSTDSWLTFSVSKSRPRPSFSSELMVCAQSRIQLQRRQLSYIKSSWIQSSRRGEKEKKQ